MTDGDELLAAFFVDNHEEIPVEVKKQITLVDPRGSWKKKFSKKPVKVELGEKEIHELEKKIQSK